MAMFQNSTRAGKRLLGFLVLSLVATCLGCGQVGDGTNRVFGRVTFNGEPVPVGVIQFTPNSSVGGDGAAGFAEIRDGKFDTMDNGRGVTSGSVTVMIDAYSMKDVNPDIKPHGDALVMGYQEMVTIGNDPSTELNFEIGAK